MWGRTPRRTWQQRSDLAVASIPSPRRLLWRVCRGLEWQPRAHNRGSRGRRRPCICAGLRAVASDCPGNGQPAQLSGGGGAAGVAARAALWVLPQTGEGCEPMYNTSATIHIMLNPLGRSRHCSAATPPGNRRCCARPAQVLALSRVPRRTPAGGPRGGAGRRPGCPRRRASPSARRRDAPARLRPRDRRKLPVLAHNEPPLALARR